MSQVTLWVLDLGCSPSPPANTLFRKTTLGRSPCPATNPIIIKDNVGLGLEKVKGPTTGLSTEPSTDDFCYSCKPLVLDLPSSFEWCFVEGTGVRLIEPNRHANKFNDHNTRPDDRLGDSSLGVMLADLDQQQSVGTSSGDASLETDHSLFSSEQVEVSSQTEELETKFERNIKKPMADFRAKDVKTYKQPTGTRHSEGQKKPSSKWNEEARYLAQPP